MNARTKRFYLLACVGFAWFFALLLADARINDDAFIGYRSFEQLQAGNGPVWNAHERVQVYTSVAWFWLGYLVRQVTDDYFLLMLSMSAACCAAMLALLRRWVANDAAWLVLVLALTASRGLVDFSTSGLEFPLVCLVAVAFMLLWRAVVASPTPRRLVRLCMLASIVPLVRHDMVLLVAPGLIHAMWAGRRCLSPRRWILLLVAASLPLVCWTAFALAYYGFPLPNTFYVKAAAGIPRLDLLSVGLGYYVAALFLDPVMLPAIAVGLLLMFRRKMAPIAAGVALHMLYVLWVGGDYMFTRFLVSDFVVACAGTAAVLRPRDFQTRRVYLVFAGFALAVFSLGVLSYLHSLPDTDPEVFENYLSLPLLACLVFLFLLIGSRKRLSGQGNAGLRLPMACCLLLMWQVADPYSFVRGGEKKSQFGINGVGLDSQIWRNSSSIGVWLADKAGSLAIDDDEREQFLKLSARAGLPKLPAAGFPYGMLALRGQAARMFDVSAGTSIGQYGMWAGTEPTVVDRMAIADPYLARNRYQGETLTYSIAHWNRGLPAEHPLATGPQLDPGPATGPGTLAGDLALATRATPLLGAERLAAVYRLNSGRYDLIEPEDDKVISPDLWEMYYYLGSPGIWLPYTTSRVDVPVRVGVAQ